MSCAERFRIRQYLRGSLWVLPLAGGVLGVLAGSGVLLLDKSGDAAAPSLGDRCRERRVRARRLRLN
jgi:hypothetical protein